MTINVGMIGAGAIADDHCNAINRYNGAAVTAVAEINPERREGLQKKHAIAKGYEKWQDLVADADVDAVAIALPNGTTVFATITHEGAAALGLTPGLPVAAIFKASAVILGVSV